MSLRFYGTLFAATTFITLSPAALRAQPLYIDVPVGSYGTLTAPDTLLIQRDIKRIPGGADVVPAKDFQDGYPLTMKDMLAKTPGVLAQPRWGEESRLSIRGSGLSRGFHMRGINLLQDGIPFNFADGSGDFQEIDPLVLRHIEVYRGGQGLRYGAATLGGAINMVTPTAHTVDYNGILRAEGGSNKTARLHAQAAKIFEGFDIFAATTKSISDGWRQQSEQNNTRFTTNIGVPLGDKAETRFYLSWNDINQEVPGTLSKQNALNNPTAAPAINILNDYARDVRSLRVSNRTAMQLDNGLKLEVGGYVNDKSLYHPIFEVIDQDSIDTGLFARLAGKYAIGGYKNEFVLGMNGGHGVNDAKRFVNIRGNRGALTSDVKQTANNIELYGENSLEFIPSWNLVTGLQATMAMRDFTDHRNAANNDDKIYRSLNPKIGLLWKAAPETEIYASLTRSSEVPTFSELVQGAFPGFIPVKLQKAWTAEIGTRGSNGPLSWDVTAYHARVRDELLQFSLAPDVPASTFNADKTIHQGIELGAGWQATNEISFSAIYNLNDFKFDSDQQFGDNDLAGAPRHQLRFSAKYERAGFSIEPNVEYVPQAAWVDFANNLKADTYATIGLKAGYDINDNINLFVDARNLTDEKHIATFSTITNANIANADVFYPGEGRSAFAGIKVKF